MRPVILVLAFALVCPSLTAAEAPTVCAISIREDISHNTLYLVRRAMREADDKKAVAIVLDMDTNGGRVDATEQIIRLLERSQIPVYTFVNQKAYSAGAFIAAATDHIYMAPGSVIGAATPVMLIPGQGLEKLPASYEEKLTSAMRALIRSTAQQKGHNPDVFDAMVDADVELVLDGKTISPKGKLLTLTNEEAARQYGEPPKPLLSAGTVDSLPALLAKLQLGNAIVAEVKPTGLEVVARWITALSPLLIFIGMVAIYLELKTPGLGVPTVVAVIAFAIYFLGFFLAGLAGWEETVVFAIGLALLAVEIFVLPGFGFAGVLGILLMLAGLVMAMVEHWPGGPWLPTWPQLQLPLLKVAGGFAGSVVVMLALGRFLPETSLFRKLELSATTSTAEGYTSAKGEAAALLGATGVAETQLRPAGKGRFDGRLVDVMTQGDLIEKGASIRIIEVQGSRVVVERAG
jgi:membrane-bound serine protease (ClpP class)